MLRRDKSGLEGQAPFILTRQPREPRFSRDRRQAHRRDRQRGDAQSRDALKLTILTAVRSNETRLATWGEFDLDAATWSIPATRMKMKQPHIVPLDLNRPGFVGGSNS